MFSRNGTSILRGQPFSTLALVLTVTIGIASIASGAATRVRWDIVSQNFSPPLTTGAGGPASALANDGSKITVTGAGTFFPDSFIPPTGGGTWETRSASNVLIGSGTYEVTGLVRWERAPFPPGDPSVPRTDLISGGTRSTGLAVLRILYSDGQRGTLVVSCTGVAAQPPNIFEGITASKSYVDYFSAVPPVGGVNGNRTLFHVE